MRALLDRGVDAVGPADDKSRVAPLAHPGFEPLGEFEGGEVGTALVEDDDAGVAGQGDIDPGALGGATLSASLGFSKSKSTSESHDETVVASNITGTDVNLVARGDGTPGSGTLSVTGSIS